MQTLLDADMAIEELTASTDDFEFTEIVQVGEAENLNMTMITRFCSGCR